LCEVLDKKYNQKMWEGMNTVFEPITMKTHYFLEFSHIGFSIHCRREVGNEVGSKAYLEEFS
jgi:hypothetical protein